MEATSQAVLPAPDAKSPTRQPERAGERPGEAEAGEILERAAERAREIAAARERSGPAPIRRVLPRGIRAERTPEEIEQARLRQQARERQERVVECLRANNVPDAYRAAMLGNHGYLPDDVRDRYRDAAERIALAIEHPGIYAMCGEIGDGKTYMACGLINAFCNVGRSAKYMKAIDYVRGYRATWKSERAGDEEAYQAKHLRLALLVLDEWQMRGDTANENMILLALIDKRYDAGKTTVLVSNHANRDEFEQTIDARVADRMCDGGGIIICDWPSLRGRIARPQ